MNSESEQYSVAGGKKVKVKVYDATSGIPLVNATVKLENGGITVDTKITDSAGNTIFSSVPEGECTVSLSLRTIDKINKKFSVGGESTAEIYLDIGAAFSTSIIAVNANCDPMVCKPLTVGDNLQLEITTSCIVNDKDLTFEMPGNFVKTAPTKFNCAARTSGNFSFPVTAYFAQEGSTPAILKMVSNVEVIEPTPTPISGSIGVALARSETTSTDDLSLWVLIRNSTEALSFEKYQSFIDYLIFNKKSNTSGAGGFEKSRFARKEELYQNLEKTRSLPFSDAESYRVLKAATEAFVMVNCGVFTEPNAFDQALDSAYLNRRDLPVPGKDLNNVFTQDYLVASNGFSENRTLPYLALVQRKLPDVPILDASKLTNPEVYINLVQNRLQNPCMLELIWSYWQEEGMLVQTMNAISRRFQNVRSPSANDPLANLEIDPLRPLNNVIWGYTQDEQHRLTVARRNSEYDHHYGLRLEGSAIKSFRPADSRSKFLEAFHHLLRLCNVFYRQDDNTTIKADAFPVLNALKEIHLILSQGAHNQFGDLPSTARVEMLMQQWILARPEFKEFLPTRAMVAYPEPWMDRVDAMKKLQGWTDTSVLQFRSLAMFGEQLLLSVRFGAWSDVYEPTQAFNWLRFWRPQVQGYIHAYRAVTGIDFTVEKSDAGEDATLPSLLLKKRLTQQQSSASL